MEKIWEMCKSTKSRLSSQMEWLCKKENSDRDHQDTCELSDRVTRWDQRLNIHIYVAAKHLHNLYNISGSDVQFLVHFSHNYLTYVTFILIMPQFHNHLFAFFTQVCPNLVSYVNKPSQGGMSLSTPCWETSCWLKFAGKLEENMLIF